MDFLERIFFLFGWSSKDRSWLVPKDKVKVEPMSPPSKKIWYFEVKK